MSLSQAFADAPWYPRVLLNKGEHAVLIPPEAIFNYEIARMKFPPGEVAAKPATDSYETQTADAELSDLAVALQRDRIPEPDYKTILEAHTAARGRFRRGDTGDVADGLPKEFASYFRGSIALRSGDTASALYEWESVLNLPPAERQFKSTWAAFMLGKLLTETDPQQSIEYFQQVRTFARLGLADTAGLAAASIGWEARVHRIQGDFRRSLELYIDQHAAGDDSAMNSMRFVASDAFGTARNLSQLVTNPVVRRVITAYAISTRRIYWQYSGEPHEAMAKWLAAVGSVEVTDPDEMEMLAMAAYRGAAFDTAARWLKRAPTSAVTLWLQAKLHVRAGKMNQALSLLTRAHAMLPDRPEDEEPPHDTLADNVFIPDGNVYPRQHILGEIGVLRMARRDYTEALDCFLRGGFWADAAYVAERVLTIEELKAYVDRQWANPDSKERDASSHQITQSVRPYIRHLLARRLVRSFLPAGSYFPDALQPTHDELMAHLKRGENESLPSADRAMGWFEGAKILKKHGLELIGTELEPDWHLTGGRLERSLTVASRTNECPKVLAPSADELTRARRHHADPEERFHYRYQAAFIALQAASLLPDNSEQKAQILHTAGTWLKDRDPETADIFYKYLVRRCRKTALGSAADVLRWFPTLDQDGNIVKLRETVEPDGELAE